MLTNMDIFDIHIIVYRVFRQFLGKRAMMVLDQIGQVI